MLGKSKRSRKYSMEIGKQIAALKFQTFVLNADLSETLICKGNFNMEKSIFSVNTDVCQHFLDASFS